MACAVENRRHLRWLYVAFWMAVIFCFSCQPQSADHTQRLFGSWNVLVRKTTHLCEYLILFCLCRWAAAGSAPAVVGKHPRLISAWAFAIATVYALTDELHQSLVPGRSATAGDVLVDMLGAAIGFACCRGGAFKPTR